MNTNILNDLSRCLLSAGYLDLKFLVNTIKELFENESDEFEVYTNYMDSHVWFESEKVQTQFERFY